MANTPMLNECNQCGELSESESCPRNPAHRTHQLSILESFARIQRTRACYRCGAPVGYCECADEEREER